MRISVVAVYLSITLAQLGVSQEEEKTSFGLEGAYYGRIDSGEPWEQSAKVGLHADVVVRMLNGGEFVFWRGSSYLPYWNTSNGRWFVDETIARSGDGPKHRPDDRSRLSRVKVLASSPARAMVHWRYIPDLDYPGMDGWAEERFTLYPDGICMREVRYARGTTLAEWEDSSDTRIEGLLLTDDGIAALTSASGGRQKSPELKLSDASSPSYEYVGYIKSERCYRLKSKINHEGSELRFVLEADGESPIYHPVIVVEGWGERELQVRLNGEPFDDYRAGYEHRMNETDLVAWLNIESNQAVEVSLVPAGPAAGPSFERAPIDDPYSHDPWVFPQGSADSGRFGGYYAHLKYSREWDDEWRVGDYADVVVQFDQSPDRFIVWRGTCNIPCWSNESNFWYTNEFCERRGGDSGLEGLCEPMQDHECRYSHARVIFSHEARVVLHWRYAPCNFEYKHPFVDETGWGDWVDEYYTIYPDEVCVRQATLYTSNPNVFNEWHEAIPLVKPGTIPEENIHMEALAFTDVDGNKRVYSWRDGFPKTFEDGPNIMLVRIKGGSMPFVIVEPRGVWVDEVNTPDEDDPRFNHYDDWGGWPSTIRKSDWERDPDNGYRLFWKTLPSHSSLMHYMWDDYENDLDGPIVWKRKIMLNGMAKTDDVNALIPLAKSWEQPPELRLFSKAYSGGSYDKAQRAYIITRQPESSPTASLGAELRFELRGSEDSPIVNPCLVIQNWPGDVPAELMIDGTAARRGADYRMGIEKTADGATALVVWVRRESTQTHSLVIKK